MKGCCRDKGISQIDFVIAVGVFLVSVTFIMGFLTDFITPIKETVDIEVLRSRAVNIFGLLEKENSELSLYTKAYRFKIKLENSKNFIINISNSPAPFQDEVVKINFSMLNLRTGVDLNSVVIYNSSGTSLPYDIDGNLVFFVSDINPGEVKNFTVFFDDDSNFTFKAVDINSDNRLNEVIFPVESLDVIQYRKMQDMKSISYENAKRIAGGEFRIDIRDKDGVILFEYGGSVPARGDVSVFEKSALLQGQDASILEGKLRVFVW